MSEQLSLDRYLVHRRRPRKRRAKPGRRRSPRARVRHRSRAALLRATPLHVTIRVRRDVPSLRNRRFVAEFRRSLARAGERADFRVVHYTIMRDHVHLIVEADAAAALASGMKSVAARLARAANRVFARTGPVVDGRFHSEPLETPRQVRNALGYVLLNARKHRAQRGTCLPRATAPDEASSGRWFDGWRGSVTTPADAYREVAPPHTWLLVQGWRRHGRISLSEIPGTQPRPAGAERRPGVRSRTHDRSRT